MRKNLLVMMLLAGSLLVGCSNQVPNRVVTETEEHDGAKVCDDSYLNAETPEEWVSIDKSGCDIDGLTLYAQFREKFGISYHDYYEQKEQERKDAEWEQTVAEINAKWEQAQAKREEEQRRKEEEEARRQELIDGYNEMYGEGITKEKFEAIRPGETSFETVELMLGKGELISESSGRNITITMYQWSTHSKTVSIIFHNGVVSTKTQFGL